MGVWVQAPPHAHSVTGPQDWNVELVPLSWLQGASPVWLMLSAGPDSLGCTLDTSGAIHYTYRFRGPYLTKQIRTSGGGSGA